MAQPLTAPFRMTFSIVVSARTHKLRVYCQAAPTILSGYGYYLYDRGGIADIDPGDAAEAFWTALKPNYDADTNPPDWVLEQRDDIVWNPVASGSTTGVGTLGTPNKAAVQMTVSLRTEDFQRIRIITLEGGIFDFESKAVGYAGLSAVLPTLATHLTTAGGGHVYEWARSKNTKLLHGSNPIVSTVWDLNDKIRRSRGYQ